MGCLSSPDKVRQSPEWGQVWHKQGSEGDKEPSQTEQDKTVVDRQPPGCMKGEGHIWLVGRVREWSLLGLGWRECCRISSSVVVMATSSVDCRRGGKRVLALASFFLFYM